LSGVAASAPAERQPARHPEAGLATRTALAIPTERNGIAPDNGRPQGYGFAFWGETLSGRGSGDSLAGGDGFAA
ncbi:MAG: hypothetical protein ACRDFX_10395, partial [Chloroflexota bacterium]